MFPYWLLFSFVAIAAAAERPGGNPGRASFGLTTLACVLIALMIGFRFEVGGDWATYLRYYERAQYASVGELLSRPDPGYQLLNKFSHFVGSGVWLTNLACGMIFAWGLHRLARRQPFPMMTILIAVPYLVIVVAMGYSRQAVAIGILMAGIASYQGRPSILRYSLYVAAAALFHRTAVFGLPLLLLGVRRNWFGNLVLTIGVCALLYDTLLSSSIDRLMLYYVRQEMISQGAAIRVGMTLIPAAIFFAFRSRLALRPEELTIYRTFAYAAVIFALMLAALPVSTVVDRLALYILPLQLIILPRISGTIMSPRFGKVVLIAYSAAALFSWLTFAVHSRYWIPYKLYPFSV